MQTSMHLQAVDMSAARADSALAWLYLCTLDGVHQMTLRKLVEQQRFLTQKAGRDALDRGFEEACSLPIEVIHLTDVVDEYRGVAATVKVGAAWSIEDIRVWEDPDPKYPEWRFCLDFPVWWGQARVVMLPGGMTLMKRIERAIIQAWLPDDPEVQTFWNDSWAGLTREDV